jgi:F-type H+-transporting ATPase subunit b
MNRIVATVALRGLLAGAVGLLFVAVERPAICAQEAKAPEAKAPEATAQETKGAAADAPAPDAKADEHAKTGDAKAAEPTAAKSEGGDHATQAGGSTAHDQGHGDPHDLSHGDAGPGLYQPQEWRFDLSIFTFVVFGLLVAILAKFAWGPIAAGLEKREQTIAKQIADAEHASAMAAKQLQEYERKLAAATEEARAIVTQARTDALSAKDKIVAEAQAAAAKERDRAVADITTAKNQALSEIAEKSVGTAISLASDIIRRE